MMKRVKLCFHSDTAVREENFALVTEFALAYGVMHPDAQNALQGLWALFRILMFLIQRLLLVFSKLFSSISRTVLFLLVLATLALVTLKRPEL